MFRRVCRGSYQLENLQRHFNISKALRPFVSKPNQFRSELGKHNALISGIFALDFLELASANVPILDLCVEAGAQTDNLINYIEEHEDYEKTMVSSSF